MTDPFEIENEMWLREKSPDEARMNTINDFFKEVGDRPSYKEAEVFDWLGY